jgi:AraC-like DNA-binding protein
MDALSEILSAVKIQGALFFNGEFTAPWCFSAPHANVIAPYLSPDAGHLIIYHCVTEGSAYAKLAGGQRETLTAGDIVIFPHGNAHLLGNGESVEPEDARHLLGKGERLRLVRFGGGGAITRFVCGFMACEKRLCEILLSGLPTVLRVHIGNDPAGKWLENSIRFSVDRENEERAGSGVVLAKLSEILLVEALRRYINSLPEDQTGWFAGARDPAIGRALTLLHKDPAQSWTVSNLAKKCGMSRTRLAERFRYFLGQSPIAYLTHWRMMMGADILQSTENSIAQVAEAVGYCSEAAFNRAFKRQFDCPPAQFRRERRKRQPSAVQDKKRPSFAPSV